MKLEDTSLYSSTLYQIPLSCVPHVVSSPPPNHPPFLPSTTVLLEHCSGCLHDVFLILVASALLLLLYLSYQGEVTEL